jgi:hypothetical protein
MGLTDDGLEAYLERLRELPFVERAELRAPGEPLIDAVLDLDTSAGRHELFVESFSSHLSRALAERAIAIAGDRPSSWIVMAPHIGAGLGGRLAEAGLHYVDRAGNCRLVLGSLMVHVQGKGAATVAAGAESKAMRAPGYQALFALLAQPGLLEGTVRELAAAADVSRQAAHDLRKRLVAMGYAAQRGRRYRFVPGGLQHAFHLWLGGYGPTLRPHLFIGSFRSRDTTPAQLETRLEETLGADAFWWGAGAAAHRLTGHYRGDKTVIHVAAPASVAELGARLSAAPARDASANLVVLTLPGPLGGQGPAPHLAHPLLAYAELTHDGRGRAIEAAEELLRRFPLSGER